MRHLTILAGAIAVAVANPALAKPDNGKGHGNGNPHAQSKGNREGNAASPGGGDCPPGLRDKGCMPPGQAKKLGRGARYQSGYGTLYTYQRIPADVRRRYRLNSRYRYYYDNGTLYAVDPSTMVVAQVISALLR